jgi:hypothetical protein
MDIWNAKPRAYIYGSIKSNNKWGPGTQEVNSTKIYEQCSILQGASFPAGIKLLTQYYSTGDEYVKVKQRTAWVAYLDARQGEISIMTDQGDREIAQEWIENKNIHERTYWQWWGIINGKK